MQNKKYCPECGLYLDISEFKKVTTKSALHKYPDGYYWCCSPCYKKRTWVFKPGDEPVNRKARRRDKLARRLSAVQNTYGLSDSEYLSLIDLQNNLCAICGEKNEGKVLCVDHDHATGKVRGLLCHNCNVGLGNLKENVQILKSAIDYVKKYSVEVLP